MKIVKFNEKEYNIPENWSEVTLGMVIRADEYSMELEGLSLIAIIAGYTGIPIGELRVSNLNKIREIVEILGFIYKEYKGNPRNSFEYKGEEYRCFDDLQEISFEEWVSVQAVLYNHRENPVRSLSMLMSILFKKEGESLDSIDIEKRSRDFLELSYTIVKDCEGFFLASMKVYEGFGQLSSLVEVQRSQVLVIMKELEGIMKRRAGQSGTSWLTRLVIGVYRRYIKYLRRDWERSFNYGHIK